MIYEPICDTVFKPWAPKDFEEYDAGPCGQCNWYGGIGEYNGFEVYNCEHGHWFTVKEQEDISDSPLIVGDVAELYRRMALAGPNMVWGDMLVEEDMEVLANETPEEKAKRLAVMAENDRVDKQKIVEYLVHRKEEKWTKGGEMKFRVPRPCKYATLYEKRICSDCGAKVPEGATVCKAMNGHRVCDRDFAGCWNHEQTRTCIYVHPDEPQWADACSGALCYDRQASCFHLRGAEPAQVNRFEATARQEQRPNGGQQRYNSGASSRPPRHDGPMQQRPYQQGQQRPYQQGQQRQRQQGSSDSDGWEQAGRRTRS